MNWLLALGILLVGMGVGALIVAFLIERSVRW